MRESRSAIADLAGAPPDINSRGRGKLGKRADEVSAINTRGARHPVRVDDFPVEAAQSFPFKNPP